jgi:hypothetical protein
MIEKIKNLKNNKSLIKILKLCLMLFVVGSICGLVVAVVSAITTPIIEKTETEALTLMFEELGVYNYQSIYETENLIFDESIEEIYIGENSNKEPVYTFKVVINSNYVRKISTIVVINQKTLAIENIKVTSKASKYSLNEELAIDVDLLGAKYDDLDQKFSEVLSSNLYFSVRNSIEISYKQFFMITGGLNDEEQE